MIVILFICAAAIASYFGYMGRLWWEGVNEDWEQMQREMRERKIR